MKINLLKKLLTLSPVVISPILVTACGTGKQQTKSGQFYLDFYQKELNTVWSTKTGAINNAADDSAANHQYDLQSNLLSEVLTKDKIEGAAEYQKEFPNLNDYNASIFDDVNINFSIPADSSGDLKLEGNDLFIYPADIIDGVSSEKHIDYSLKMANTSKLSGKQVDGSLNLNLHTGFINYSTSTAAKLSSNKVDTVYGNEDMSRILVGTEGGGLDVGTKQKDGGYTFVNYNASNSGLAGNLVRSVYGSADMSEILVGELNTGLDIGILQSDGRYDFTNYRYPSANVWGVYGNADLSKILVGSDEGLSIATRLYKGRYLINWYSEDEIVYGLYGNADLSNILVGSWGEGLEVGTATEGFNKYKFTDYSTSSSGKQELASDTLLGIYGNANLSTILLGTDGEGLDVGTKQADGKYNFKDYSTSNGPDNQRLSNDYVWSVHGNKDLSTILLGTDGGGLDVGTRKSASDPYTFTNYDTSSSIPLSSDRAVAVCGNSNLSAILVGTYGGGIDISSNLWFA